MPAFEWLLFQWSAESLMQWLLYCLSNVIKQYFYDIPQLLKISCSDTKVIDMFTLAFVLSSGVVCCVFILVSYSYIFSTVFQIQSEQTRYKAFSTCIPHWTVFCLFVFTVMFSYMRPKSLSSPSVDLLAATLYTLVVPPLMNPIIYSPRNKEIQGALWKISRKRLELHMVAL